MIFKKTMTLSELREKFVTVMMASTFIMKDIQIFMEMERLPYYLKTTLAQEEKHYNVKEMNCVTACCAVHKIFFDI